MNSQNCEECTYYNSGSEQCSVDKCLFLHTCIEDENGQEKLCLKLSDVQKVGQLDRFIRKCLNQYHDNGGMFLHNNHPTINMEGEDGETVTYKVVKIEEFAEHNHVDIHLVEE